MKVDIAQVAVLVTTILGIIALGAFLNKVVKERIAAIVKEVATGNGSNIAQYVMKTSNKIDVVQEKLDETAGLSRDNRTLITEAKAEIREVRDNLIRHEAKFHADVE